MDRPARIALLIDADNAPAAKIDFILNELATFGETNVRRAYGNWKKSGLRSWEDALHQHAIRPMQQFDYSKGKNASDMAIVIDALDLLYTDRPDAFGIVSSDADFTPLVMHLRSKGSAVYGFGARQTPLPFQNACSRFLVLAPAEPERSEVPQRDNGSTLAPLRVPPESLRDDGRLVNLLRSAIQATRDEDGWAKVGRLGHVIGNQASFDPRNYGYSSLSKLLKATGLFELDREGTPEVAVREVRQGRPAASPAG